MSILDENDRGIHVKRPKGPCGTIEISMKTIEMSFTLSTASLTTRSDIKFMHYAKTTLVVNPQHTVDKVNSPIL